MSNELDKIRKKAYHEWVLALDTIEDAVFIYDKDFRILQCNKGYQQYAQLPFDKIIGQPYFQIFPKLDAPLEGDFKSLVKPFAEEILYIEKLIFRSRINFITDTKGFYLFTIQILEDITKTTNLIAALNTSETSYRRLFESAKDGILIMDAKTELIIDANPFIINMLKYTLDELVGKNLWEIGIFADKQESKRTFKELKEKKYVRYEDMPLQDKEKNIIEVEFISNLYKVGKEEIIQCNIRDISKRVLAEKSLKQSEARFKAIFEGAKDGILLADITSKKFILANEKICKMLGYKQEEIRSVGVEDIIPAKEYDYIFSLFIKQAKGEIELATNIPTKRKDGSIFFTDVNSFPLTFENKTYIAAFFRDVTDRKEAEEELRMSEDKFRSITTSAQDAIMMIDENGNISYWNKAAEKIFAYSEQEVLGMNLHKLLAPKHYHKAHKIAFKHFKESGKGDAIGKTLELIALKKDKTEFPIELSLSAVMRKNKWNAIGIVRDITESKKNEAALKHTARALRTLSAANMTLVYSKNEKELLQNVTDIIVKVEEGGYALAVVCYLENDEEQSIIPVAYSGADKSHFWEEDTNWGKIKKSKLPISLAINTSKTQIYRDIAKEAKHKPWRDAALSQGYMSNIAIPLLNKTKTFGAISIYSTEVNSFDDDEVKLLEELADDLLYGIINLRVHNENERQSLLLQESLEQSIQTIAATLESRDPYTAGHQRRVSELAMAIAQEMGLSEKQIQGVHFAAIIHDLGKINIPAEILSKPGKLNDIEYKLIQMHPQAGYDIIKDIKYPWPIANIILQHHEKINGSGYPKGLKGDEILLESKIISVADVVEAISSHRPYRASLGIEYALSEITQAKGIEYDELVVDACLKLFNEKKFKFSE